MNLKKLGLILILGTVGNGFASDSFPQGIYVGLGGGYNRTGTRFLGGEYESNVGFNGTNPDTKKKNLNSFLLTGFLGHLHVIKEYSLTMGGELFWTYPTGNQKFNLPTGAATTDSKFKPRYEYGFKATFGYLINTVNHLYTILGFSNKNFNEKITSTFTNAGLSADSSLSKNFSKTYFLLGIGFERAFDKIKYGVEGIYQIGNKKTSLTHSTSVTAITGGAGDVIVTPGTRKLENSYTVLFKISYSFDIFN